MLVTLSTLFPFFIEQKSDIEEMFFLNRANAISKNLLFSAKAFRGLDFDVNGYSYDDPYVEKRTKEKPDRGVMIIVEKNVKLGKVKSPIYTEGGVVND